MERIPRPADLGERLRLIREGVLGLSRDDLSAELRQRGVRGSSTMSIRRYEGGDRVPRTEFVQAVAELAGVSVAWIVDDEQEARPESGAESWSPRNQERFLLGFLASVVTSREVTESGGDPFGSAVALVEARFVRDFTDEQLRAWSFIRELAIASGHFDPDEPNPWADGD